MTSWEEISRILEAKKLDPVGKEDKDIDNDGDHDESDKYLLNRRRVRSKIIAPKEKLKTDRNMFSIPKDERDAARERLLAKAKAKRMKEEVEEVEEGLTDLQRRRYLGRKPGESKERLKRINDRKDKKAALAAMEKQYKGMKSGIYSSYEAEGEQLDEFLGGKPGDGYIGHPNLDIKNPLAKKQTKKEVIPGARGGGMVNRTAAGIGDARMRQNQQIKSLLSQSNELEGEQLEEKAMSRAQQRFMGMVYAAKKGEKPASPQVAAAAASMSKKAAKDFAKTEHEGLPEKKEEVTLVQKIIEELISEAPKGTISGGKSQAKKYKAVAKQAKLAAAVNKAMKDDDSEPPVQDKERGKKEKAKEEVKSKNTATERAARTTAAARIRAARIARETEREKEAARTERQRERLKDTEKSRQARRKEKKKEQEEKAEAKRRREEEKTKTREARDKEKQKSAEERKQASEKEKEERAATQKRESERQALKNERKSVLKGVSMQKVSDKEGEGAAASKVASNIGTIAVTAAKAGKWAIKAGMQKAKEVKQDRDKKKKEEEEKNESFSNWREEFIFEVEGQEDLKKVIDVSKKKNKIEINPNMGESCEKCGKCGKSPCECEKKDMRELPTKVNLIKNKMRAMGMRNPIVMVNSEETLPEDWQSVNRKDKTDGLSQKAVDAYRRENPGSKLQTAVTEKKPTGKRAERRKSFCRRMSGMKKRLTSAETARDPDSRINKALRRWNC